MAIDAPSPNPPPAKSEGAASAIEMPSSGLDSARLAEAFQIFNQASEGLATAYGALERQVESLTAELASANAEANRLREEAERHKRLAAMGEMAAQLAHQLRTPLAAALLYAGNLELPNLPESHRLSLAGKTVDRLKHLERLIRDMLLFARGEALGRERFAVAELFHDLAQTAEPLARNRQVGLDIVMPDAGMTLIGNRKSLAGALLNLLENALQAADGGPGARVRLEVRSEPEQLILRVSDNGRGMAPEVLGRLFEPFFTTRSEGTGLGLAIARGVIRAHGGDIAVRSAPGQGTDFDVSLPLVDC